MDIFGLIAFGILASIITAAISVFAGLIASAIVAVKRHSKQQNKQIPAKDEPEPLPYSVNYSKVEDQHGNVHEGVMIQYKPDEASMNDDLNKAVPEQESTANEPSAKETPTIQDFAFNSTKRTVNTESKRYAVYLFALNRLKRQIRALKKDTEREKAEIENLLRSMRQYRGRMSGEQYEVYCAIMLTHIGYKNVILTPTTGDFGADIIATKGNWKYCFQCKCYSYPVGVQAVQEVHSAMTYYNCECAGVITNSTFTPSAMELADKLNVMMIDDF